MKLTVKELTDVLRVLEKIDRGLIHPRVPDRIGRFLRQYERGHAELDKVLADGRLQRRADAAISGQALGVIELHAILKPKVSLLGFPLGEVAGTIAISEELGVLTSLDMWLKGPVANAAYNMLLQSPGLRLSGDYRWNPPARLTPGEAHLEPSDGKVGWQHARCMKVVADDLARPPHALEYVLDYRMGPPSLKYFRCVCAVKRNGGWEALPALTQPRQLDVVVEPGMHVESTGMFSLLVYCEPWSRQWTIVAAAPITVLDALSHAITWADFQRELDGSELDGPTIAGIRDALRAAGIGSTDFGEPNLRRLLLPSAAGILRWLRGVT